MNPGSVSVIVPTYNRASLVTQAVDSLLAQTRVPDEIIVVNDGSKDDTEKVLQKYQRPVKVINQPNGGLASARNAGLKAATGDFVAFLDDDDTLTPDSIEKRASFLEKYPEKPIVYGNIEVIFIDEASSQHSKYQIRDVPITYSGDVFSKIILRNLAPIHAFMARRTCFENNVLFRSAFPGVEDYDLWVRLAEHFHFYYIDNLVGYYRFHASQMSSIHRQKMYSAEIKIREEAFTTPTFAKLSPAEQARAYSVQATRYMLLGNTKQSRYWYRRAISIHPQQARNYFLLGLTFLGAKGFQSATDKILQLRSKSSSGL